MGNDAQMTAEDDPELWAGRLDFAINSRVRVGGFTPSNLFSVATQMYRRAC